MSQSQPTETETDLGHTLPIDETGELARFSVGGGPGFTRKSTVEVRVDGDAPASYHVEVGTEDADDRREIQWFEDSGYVYSDTDSVGEAWEQAFRYLRIMIDEPAPTGSEARVAVCYGR